MRDALCPDGDPLFAARQVRNFLFFHGANGIGIEDDHVGGHARLQQAPVGEAHQLRRHPRHLVDRLLQRQHLFLAHPLAQHLRRVFGAGDHIGVSAGIGNAEDAVGAANDLGDGVGIVVASAQERKLGLEVLGQRQVDHRVQRMLSFPLAELPQGEPLELLVLWPPRPRDDRRVPSWRRSLAPPLADRGAHLRAIGGVRKHAPLLRLRLRQDLQPHRVGGEDQIVVLEIEVLGRGPARADAVDASALRVRPLHEVEHLLPTSLWRPGRLAQLIPGDETACARREREDLFLVLLGQVQAATGRDLDGPEPELADGAAQLLELFGVAEPAGDRVPFPVHVRPAQRRGEPHRAVS